MQHEATEDITYGLGHVQSPARAATHAAIVMLISWVRIRERA